MTTGRDSASSADKQAPARSVLLSREAAGGLLMIAFGLFTLWQSWGLTTGTARQIGPGMVPQALSVLLAACGVLLVISALRSTGLPLERWKVRGPLFILGAAVVFGLVIKPLGLLIASPIAIAVGGLASPETRLREVLVFCVVMTAFCVGLFKYVLALPIPLAPWLFGY